MIQHINGYIGSDGNMFEVSVKNIVIVQVVSEYEYFLMSPVQLLM